MASQVNFKKFFVQNKETKAKCRIWYYTTVFNGENCICVNQKDYGYDLFDIMPKDILVKNTTDSMTDYFDKSTAYIPESHPLYKEASKYVK